MRQNAEETFQVADADAPVCEPGCDNIANLEPPAPELRTNGHAPINRGRFTRDQQPRPRHGLRSTRVKAGEMPEQQAARAALGERIAAIVNDQGGAESVSALRLGQIEQHTKLELIDAYLWANLQRLGPLTGKGKTRAALTAWLSVVDRLHRSAIALGLERKRKPVNPIDAVRAAVAEANSK